MLHYFHSHLKMTAEKGRLCDILSLVFIISHRLDFFPRVFLISVEPVHVFYDIWRDRSSDSSDGRHQGATGKGG